MEIDHQKRGELQGLMVFMASVSHGLETVLGRGAMPVTFRAGRTLGLKSDITAKTTDVIKALEVVDQELRKRNLIWPFEPWKKSADTSLVYDKEGKTAVKLVFRNCMIRASLFRYSHEQKQALCMMNHGIFCGYMQKITGQRAELDIIHAGENACLKELTLGS